MSEQRKNPEWISLWQGYAKSMESWRSYLENSQQTNKEMYENYKNAFEQFFDSWQKTYDMYRENWQKSLTANGQEMATAYMEMMKKFSEPWVRKTLD